MPSAGHLKRIVRLTNPHAGGEYHGQNKEMHPMFRMILPLLITLATSACVQAPAKPVPSTAKESPAMTATTTSISDHSAAPITPKLTGEQVLTKLLDLIRNSKSIKEFTPGYLSKMMGVEFVTYSPGEHEFAEQVTPNWWYSMQMGESVTTQKIPRFDFMFNSDPGTTPDMTNICQIDFEKFASELEAMGFTREPYYDFAPPPPPGEDPLPHGGLVYWSFYRPELGIRVYPRGEANEPHEKISHACVKMVLIT